jgi:hypothetical protein
MALDGQDTKRKSYLHRITISKAIISAAGLLLSTGAHATTYDAFSSFDGTQFAGHFWYTAYDNTNAIPLTAPASCLIPADACLEDVAAGGLPGVFKFSTAQQIGSAFAPDDRLLVHPGSGNLSLLVFFFAPVAGVYDFSASFNVLDVSPTGVDTYVFSNSPSYPGEFVGLLNSPGQSVSKTGTVSLDAGQWIDVLVGNHGDFTGDSTGLNFTLNLRDSAVPEPSTWAMMLAGFAFVGGAMRRRNQQTKVRFAF